MEAEVLTKVVLDISMSLDGFIAQPDDNPGPIHEWLFAADEPHAHYPMLTPRRGPSHSVLDATYEATGAVIAGRRTYDLTGGWGGQHPMGVPVIVVTHEAPADVPNGPTDFTFVDGIAAAVEQARQTAQDRDVWVMGGASMAAECVRHGLLDEIQIHLAPVMLGTGVRMFDGVDTQRLAPISVVDAGDVVHLRYRVA
jgi:dihydrofolate reductase